MTSNSTSTARASITVDGDRRDSALAEFNSLFEKKGLSLGAWANVDLGCQVDVGPCVREEVARGIEQLESELLEAAAISEKLGGCLDMTVELEGDNLQLVSVSRDVRGSIRTRIEHNDDGTFEVHVVKDGKKIEAKVAKNVTAADLVPGNHVVDVERSGDVLTELLGFDPAEDEWVEVDFDLDYLAPRLARVLTEAGEECAALGGTLVNDECTVTWYLTMQDDPCIVWEVTAVRIDHKVSTASVARRTSQD